ncbi:MAG: hypothetical protein ABH971_01540 [bacterium]
MDPYELAWKGTTIKQKKELLKYSLSERDRLVNKGKIKDGQLGLASTCIDIIGTAKAVMNEIDEFKKVEWQKLLDEVKVISKKAVELAERENKNDWSSSDYEVAGTIILNTSKNIKKAIDLFKQGVIKAENEKNISSR